MPQEKPTESATDQCYCLECAWFGDELELVPDINVTFSVCPICKSQSIVFL